jgi:hypothetical protein
MQEGLEGVLMVMVVMVASRPTMMIIINNTFSLYQPLFWNGLTSFIFNFIFTFFLIPCCFKYSSRKSIN